MTNHRLKTAIGSRSPRRRELLESRLGSGTVLCLPPSDSQEPGFDGLTTDEAIAKQVAEIANLKQSDVRHQLAWPPLPGNSLSPETREPAADSSDSVQVLVTGDTVVVAGAPGQRVVLGQPEHTADGDDIRRWFRELLLGRNHEVWTAWCVSSRDTVREGLCRTVVRFRDASDEEIEWYIASGEPAGKAGGYAVQGLGATFVHGIHGSLTNVIGLPVEEVVPVIRTLSDESLR